MNSPEVQPCIPLELRGSVKHHHSNLIPALLLLKPERRSDALLLGEWCRLLDDIADTHSLGTSEKRRILEAWLLAIKSGEGLPIDFQTMIRRHNLDQNLLADIVHGMLMDTDHARYKTFADLEIYCRRVASTVGLVSASIFGARVKEVQRYAEALGVALQLTNILRDVAEDAARGRIYLPLEDLGRFGVSEADIFESHHTPQMTHLLNHQAERADSIFAKAELAWSEMSANQKRLMRPARLMSAIYRDILLQMHHDRYDVMSKRYKVNSIKKMILLLQIMTARS
jgi:phytoene synthase